MIVNPKLIRHIEIKSINKTKVSNMIDIEVKDDNSFTLSNGIISHNSASRPINGVRDSKTMGVFPIRGKLVNVTGLSVAKALKTQELSDINAIIGADMLSGKVDVSKLRYGKIVIAADQDLDGIHIKGLIINFFTQYAPEIIEEGLLYFINTPIKKVTIGKKVIEFFSDKEYTKWAKKQTKPFKTKHYKGLGTSSLSEFKEYISNDKYFEQVTIDSEYKNSLDLVFNKKRPDDRKLWLSEN